MGPTRFFFSPLPTPVPYASHTERRLRFSHTECPRSPSRSSPPPVPSHRRPRPSISVALLLRAGSLSMATGFVMRKMDLVVMRAHAPFSVTKENTFRKYNAGNTRQPLMGNKKTISIEVQTCCFICMSTDGRCNLKKDGRILRQSTAYASRQFACSFSTRQPTLD
uniref:Uncharacterized protein n=1 Tax=Oryza glumipatula TaxID=40148 RepID=A0A0E0A9H3_9ORYZ